MRIEKMLNIFGEEITVKISDSRIKPVVRRGYAATPGSAENGEKCKTCQHAVKCNEGGAKQFYKCDLMRKIWTKGQGSDILINSPACRFYVRINLAKS